MKKIIPLFVLVLLGVLGLVFPSIDLSALSKAEFDTGDTAWLLTSSALVLIMTPGLAFFYGLLLDLAWPLAMILVEL